MKYSPQERIENLFDDSGKWIGPGIQLDESLPAWPGIIVDVLRCPHCGSYAVAEHSNHGALVLGCLDCRAATENPRPAMAIRQWSGNQESQYLDAVSRLYVERFTVPSLKEGKR